MKAVIVSIISTSFAGVCLGVGVPVNESHCLSELPKQWHSLIGGLGHVEQFSMATSVSVSPFPMKGAGTLLVAGDFIPDDVTDKYTGKSFLQAMALPKNGKEPRDVSYTKTWDWDAVSKPLDITNFRSITRVLAHPSADVAFVTGRRRVAAYKVTSGKLLWSLSGDHIPLCDENNPTDDIFYDGLLVLPNDDEHVLVSGTCNNSQIVIVDVYSTADGALVHRNMYSVYELLPGLAKMVNFGIIPPETSMSAPLSAEVFDTVGDAFFYLGVNHALFMGIARMLFDTLSHQATVNTEGLPGTLQNPSAYVHRSVLADGGTGLISLMDSSLFDIFTDGGKHLIRYDLTKKLESWSESPTWTEWVWYARHWKLNLKLDWTLSSHGYAKNAKHVHVLSTPIPTSVAELLKPFESSFISQHDSITGEITGGGKMDFIATDGVLSNDGNTLFAVGFKYRLKHFPSEHWVRYASVSAFGTEADDSKCIGCEPMYYGGNCEQKCTCHSGYCDDDLQGTGRCWCGLDTFGDYCDPCYCAPTAGICHSGNAGSGYCAVCVDINPFTETISWPTTYGPLCKSPSHCVFGVSNPLGEMGTDGCLFCMDEMHYGPLCNSTCNCTANEHCDYGVEGTGCHEKKEHSAGVAWSESRLLYAFLAMIFFSLRS